MSKSLNAGWETPDTMNTFSLKQLADKFDVVIQNNKGELLRGLSDEGVCLEDSLPWFEIVFKKEMGVKQSKEFCQSLADEMNIRVLFNRVEGNHKESVIYGVLDIDYVSLEEGKIKNTDPMPALSKEEDWSSFMEDYGLIIIPGHVKLKNKKNKVKM